ncbi:MAG TPA: hypothetical protein VK557_11680, partial [Pyrinomonadaceae bacterium]|nr:hypothetical protein [Pyrinomonadaceae bacterium]
MKISIGLITITLRSAPLVESPVERSERIRVTPYSFLNRSKISRILRQEKKLSRFPATIFPTRLRDTI